MVRDHYHSPFKTYLPLCKVCGDQIFFSAEWNEWWTLLEFIDRTGRDELWLKELLTSRSNVLEQVFMLPSTSG